MKTVKSLKFGRRHWRGMALVAATAMLPAGVLLAQNSTSGDRPAVPRPAGSALPDEAKDRDDLIKAAQDRLKKLKGESTAPATITDQSGNGETTVRARPTGAPAAGNTGTATASGATAEAPKPAKPLVPSASADKPPAPSPAPAPVANRPPVPAPVPLSANTGAVPAPVPLKPRYEKTQNTADSGEAMEITAHESVMDEKNNMATFKGDVVVHHPTFVMTSEHLEVFMNDKENPQLGPDGKEPPFKNAIATGPMVIIEQTTVGQGGTKTVQIAKARKAVFDGITGDTILTGGPPYLQKGKQIIRPKASDAKIVLKSNGEHRVEGRNTVKIPIKSGPGGAKGPGLPGGTLDSITNKKNR